MKPGPIRTLVALDDGISPESISSSLPSDAEINLVGVVEGLEAASRALEDTICDVLAIACRGYSERVLFLIESAVRQQPSRPVIILSDGSPNGFVRRVFEVGADDIVMLPQSKDSVRFSIQKALARKEGTAHGGHGLARMIVVLGPKGGTGKTLTATNLAVALQQAGRRTVLVDLDLQFGDVALCMGLPPGKTVHDLVGAGGPLDEEKLESFLVEHETGVKALLAPSRPDYASAISVEAIRDIYSLLRTQHDVIIVDTPPGFTPEVIASIDMSTDIVMVGMLDSLSLKNTKLGLETLDLMSYRSENVRFVLNRAHSRVGISANDVTAVIGREPDIFVPSDREIPVTVNEGVPIVTALPQSEAAKAFRQLAALYVVADAGAAPAENDEAAAAASGSRRRVFGRRGSGSS